MNSFVENIYDRNKDVFGLPQSYKGIDFFPIKMKDIEAKTMFYQLLFHPKNYIPDKEIIKMSYLKFLMFIIYQNYKSIDPTIDARKNLLALLKSITKIDNVKYKLGNEDISIIIGESIFNEYEFDNVRAIILEQNGSSIEYIEEYNPELEKKMSFMNRSLQDVDGKDELYSFCALTKMSEEEAGERTLYQFKCRFEREMLMKEYDLFKPLEISGQISSKSGREIFKHYLSHISHSGRYSSILIDKDQFMEDSGLGKANADGNINV